MSKKQADTAAQYAEQASRCRDLFVRKLHDYEASWRVLRLASLTDQLYIKVLRIRNIETMGKAFVADSIEDEFIGLVNYGLIGLIQSGLETSDQVDIGNEQALSLYDKVVESARMLMLQKNHDYGEAWRLMRISSFTDLILSKVLRVKQIEELEGMTEASEGIPANYQDIVNYALFALIRLNEETAAK